MPFAEFNGCRLFYTDEGGGESRGEVEGEGGPPMLFVHGYTCDSHDWSWQLAHFRPRRRVIAVDLRGHGRSDVPASGGFRPEDFQRDLVDLIETVAGGPVVAVGHSLGGVLVSLLAVERPDLVHAVVPIDPGYLIPVSQMEGIQTLLEMLNSGDPVAAAQAMLGALYTEASPPALKTWQMRRIAGHAPHVLRETLTGLMNGIACDPGHADNLKRRKVPVLAIYASAARAATESALFADARSRAVSFEGSGHWPHQERHREVNSIIDRWLARLTTG